MSEQPAVAVGQVWEEVDPRLARLVTVCALSHPFNGPHGLIDGTVTIMCNGRRTKAKLSRFNGQSGGYRYVEGP